MEASAHNSEQPLDSQRATPGKNQVPSLTSDILGIGVLFVLAASVFRKHLWGTSTFFGNPDRLDNHLKVLKHHVDSLAAGHLDAWSDVEILGYDTFSLPYTFPNPLTYLTYWFGPENIYITAGFVSALLLALAGISAYVALRQFVDNKFTALVGAVLYQFSTITVLKVSQNDMSFAVFILIPLLILAIRRTEHLRLALHFAILSGLLFVLLQFTFLQKAAYTLLLVGSYALYRSWATRDWRPVTVFGSAALTALIAALPRIWALGIAMSQYTRGETEHAPHLIPPFEMLRWFDNTIFGKSYADPVFLANATRINLSEGFLIYVSSLAPVLIIAGLIRYRARWFGFARQDRNDAVFFFWVLVFLFAVFAAEPVFMLVYYLFLKIDFIHARILIAGLLPMAIIVSLLLADVAPAPLGQLGSKEIFLLCLSGLLLALLIVAGIEVAAGLAQGAWSMPTTAALYVDKSAVIRIALSTGVALVLLSLLKLRTLSPVKTQVVFIALCLAITGQTLRAADFQINGTHTLTGALPFKSGGFYSAQRTKFRIPSRPSLDRLHIALRRDEYRSVLICDAQIAGGFCAAHIGEFWRLRLADGYYGLGVPERIAALPWKTGLGPRHVVFDSVKNLPWQLLGFLNVKYAVIADDALYRNVPPSLDDDWPNLARHRPEVLENPAKVVPRAFFAQQVQPVGSARSAASKIFSDAGVADVTQISFAEGVDNAETFATRGQVTISGGGDRLALTLDKSEKPRFLVLNELFYPGWTAQVDGRETTIYPTNAVMRGVIVPAGATAVTFRYRPFVKSNAAKALYISSLLLLVIGVFGFRRLSRKQ